MGRSLSNEEVQQVLYEIKKDEVRQTWPDFEGLRKLARAVNDKLPYVTIGEMRFSIRYTTHFGDAVFIRPADTTSFVPCGYFNKNTLKGYMV